jgi:hypothetical protein
VVARVGMPQFPLVHWLACSIIVWPPDKRAITRGGGLCPIVVSPTAAE